MSPLTPRPQGILPRIRGRIEARCLASTHGPRSGQLCGFRSPARARAHLKLLRGAIRPGMR